MRIIFVQIARAIRRRIEENGRIQSGDAAELAFGRLQVIGHEAGNVRPNTVPDQVQRVGRHATRMVRYVLDQLRHAQAAEARPPLHLAETRFTHGPAIIDDDDVVVAFGEVCLAQIRTWRVVAAAAEAVDDDLGRMRPIEMRVIEGLRIEYVEFFRFLLRAPRV